MFLFRLATIAAALFFFPASLYAAEQPFVNWVDDFKRDATREGISHTVLDRAFYRLSPNERVIELDRRQPEGTMTFAQYLDRVITDKRVEEGRRLLAQHRPLLDKVAAKYGVQPHYIVALWGIETSYGKNTGGFSVIESLATLAYDGRREAFFRKELMHALKIADAGHIALEDMQGSWAGAMGQCQFMPSSFLAFAQDYNNDGRKDIWHSLPDVFASIANYLSTSGWQGDFIWGREVKLPTGFDRSLSGTSVSRSLAQWQALGVRKIHGGNLPDEPIKASVVFPDEADDRAYLVYDNYKTLLKWNRSLYFATAVGILADKLTGR